MGELENLWSDDGYSPLNDARTQRMLEMMHRPMAPVPKAAAAADDTKPCNGCPKLVRCRAELLACAAASLYAHGATPRRWALAPRQPSRAQWQALFPEQGNGTARQLSALDTASVAATRMAAVPYR